MIGKGYREKRTAVLDILARYQSYRGEKDDGVNPDFLGQRVKAIEEGKYILAVVGETKAGKSTLINALLGEQILPTDILQSSSAIVEIFKSDKKYVVVRYADGNSVRVDDDPNTPDVDEAFEHLRRVGSLDDRFRSIPTTLIDTYIVQGRIQHGQPLPIEDMQEASKLLLKGKESLIEEYVKGRSLADIPVEIIFGYPLPFALDEFRLVDSPGVNAIGGVQDKTFEYLHNANAVLFVHSIEGPIENSSFRDFVTHVIPNRTRQSLFLILSKSGSKSDIEIESKVTEARSMFSEVFDPDRVLHVDSMLKAVSEDIKDFDTARELKLHYVERRQYFRENLKSESRSDWRDGETKYDTKLKLLNNVLDEVDADADLDVVRNELDRRSNFDQVEKVIDELSMRAPELQLSELLEAVKLGYANQISAYEQNIELLNKKRKHPQTFDNDISLMQSAHSDYEYLMTEFVEKTTSTYTGVQATYRSDLEKLKSDYSGQLEGAKDANAIKQTLANFDDANCKFVDDIANEIRLVFETELRLRGEEFKAKHSIMVPTINVGVIEANAKEEANRKRKDIEDAPGLWRWLFKIYIGTKDYNKMVEISVHHGYFKNYKSSAIRAVTETIENDHQVVPALVENFITSFLKSLKSLVASCKQELEKIKGDKSNNDEILSDIAAAEKKKKEILSQVRHVKEILEDLR